MHFCIHKKHIHLHISKNIARTPAEFWDIKNRRVPNTRLLLSLVVLGTRFASYKFCRFNQYWTRNIPYER